MAFIGMRRPVYALVSAYTEGSAITYGTGEVIAPARRASITYEREDNPFYGDDVEQENDVGLNGYTIELETTALPIATRAALLGEVPVTGTGTTVTEYQATSANSPYVGFGFIRVLMVGGVKKYEAFWFYRLRFSLSSEEANTKEKSISWGAPTLSGTGTAVYLDSTGEPAYFAHNEFATLAAANTWLNTKANISE